MAPTAALLLLLLAVVGLVKLHRHELPRSATLQQWRFVRQEGYLPEGTDARPPAEMALEEATRTCDQDDTCMGFTYADDPSSTSPLSLRGRFLEATTLTTTRWWSDPAPRALPRVYFKTAADDPIAAPGWSTWVKQAPPSPPDGHFTVSGLSVQLRHGTGTVLVLSPALDPMPPFNFSFVPPLSAPGRPNRAVPRCQHLGDVTLRVRPVSATTWAMYSSAAAGPDVAVTPAARPSRAVLAAHDITAALMASPAQPHPLDLRVVRSYETAENARGLVIRWNLTNTAAGAVEVGGLGFTLPADANSGGLTLEQIAYINSFLDPAISGDRGWAEWVRVTGNSSLLVLPHTRNAKLEAWRPLLEDCQFDGGLSEWTVLSGAWAEEWELNQQAPVLTLDAALAAKGVWPQPRSPWPEWYSNETFRLRDVKHWNPPTTLTLAAGETASFALRLVLSDGGPRQRSDHLVALGAPAVHGVPGYVLATDMTTAKLLVRCPPGLSVVTVAVSPAGVLSATLPPLLPPAAHETEETLTTVAVTGLARGRARLSLRFSDGSELAVHYHVLPPLPQQIAALGRHWAEEAWLPRDYPDPFGRSASVMPWDREDGRHILQDSRAYIVGLSDDAGAANNLGLASKVNFAPVQSEVARVDAYIQWTLYGVKPDVASPPLRSLQDPETDGVRMTMFYYPIVPPPAQDLTPDVEATRPASADTATELGPRHRTPSGQVLLGVPPPPGTSPSGGRVDAVMEALAAPQGFAYNFTYTEQDKCGMPVSGPIWCMTELLANQTYRSYNYPHQTAVYWAMYRVARHYDGVVTRMPWAWYLERAFKTSMKIGSPNVGLMDGTVFREVLLALHEEGESNSTVAGWATQLEAAMRSRAVGWAAQTFPYGSEFNFDTTGQEEVYVWLKYFGYDDAAARTLDAVLGFMRSLPNWAWHGGSRSMGDLGNNGKWFINKGVERGLMHYRAGLNMIPLLEAFRADPTDHLLLEIAMGALAGQMCNIDENGATSMMFHSFPFVNEFDPHSGDYGLGFFGHSVEAGAYYVQHPQFGDTCYLCDVSQGREEGSVVILPRDSFRQRVFLAPLGLYLVTRTGTITSVAFDRARGTVAVSLSAAQCFEERDVAPLFSRFVVEVRQTSHALPNIRLGWGDRVHQRTREVFDVPVVVTPQPSGEFCHQATLDFTTT